MNALNTIPLLRKPAFLLSALGCLHSVQAHPGHDHDGGWVHTVSHGLGWTTVVVVMAAMTVALVLWKRRCARVPVSC
jgi:hypothetical protein